VARMRRRLAGQNVPCARMNRNEMFARSAKVEREYFSKWAESRALPLRNARPQQEGHQVCDTSAHWALLR
jgi:hypothetical protein